MAENFLETGTVNYNFEKYSYDSVLAELNFDIEQNNNKIVHIKEMAEAADDEKTRLNLEQEYKECLQTRHSLSEGMALLKEYPDEFPALYAMISREDTDESGVKFEFNEILAKTEDIVTEAQDVNPKGRQLALNCQLPDTGEFSIVVTPYDKAGEDKEQLKARINFPDKTIENLNEERLKAIIEFCEKKGLSVYDLSIPMKDGLIDIDEKLAELTKKVLETKRNEDIQQPGPSVEESNENEFITLIPEIEEVNINIDKPKKTQAKKEITLDFIRNEMMDFLEKDLHKTRGLTYFERTKNIDGLKTYVFSLYDKPNKDNPKLDGVEDKNGNHPPTYSYRFYVSQNPKTGKFVFGYATPGGKKMDDTMAGDFLGVVKKTGVTHVRFRDLPNSDKGVWMMACAEKGLVPIGISLNTAKAKAMVEAARKKLSTEEFLEFKYRLADQMIKNAKEKCKNPDDKNYGLSKSEMDFICGLKTGRDFENFRLAYEADDGLYARVIDQIDKGSKDSEKGAATTFGSMRALRSVFDIYFNHHNEDFGKRLEDIKPTLSAEEYEKLKLIPANKKVGELSTAEFMLIYDTILDSHIKRAEEDILRAYERETKRKPQRADSVVLASDLFPRAKGALNEINIILNRNGIDTLTLPTEHKGLEFARPVTTQQNTNNNQQQTNTNQTQNSPVRQNAQNAR